MSSRGELPPQCLAGAPDRQAAQVTEDVPSPGKTSSSFHRGTGSPAGPSLLSLCPGCVCGVLSLSDSWDMAVMVRRAWGPWVRQGPRPEPTALRQAPSPPPLKPSARPALPCAPAGTTTPLSEEGRQVFGGDSRYFGPCGPDSLFTATRLCPLSANMAVAVTFRKGWGWGWGSRAVLRV